MVYVARLALRDTRRLAKWDLYLTKAAVGHALLQHVGVGLGTAFFVCYRSGLDDQICH